MVALAILAGAVVFVAGLVVGYLVGYDLAAEEYGP